MILLHPNLATNARVVSKFRSLLPHYVIMHRKHDTYMNILNHIYI